MADRTSRTRSSVPAGRSIELDPLLNALKPLGRFQLVQSLLFYLGWLLPCYVLFSIVFTGQETGYRCAPAPNGTRDFLLQQEGAWANGSEVHYGQCSIDVISNTSGVVTQQESPCLYGVEYDKVKDFSIFTEFDLVCGRSALKGLSQSVLMMGQGVGAILFTSLSDKYGRKRIHVISQALLIVGSIAMGFSPGYTTFAILKFVLGALQQGCILTTVTAVVESFPGRYRGFLAGVMGAVIWALVNATLTPWAYLLRGYSWRTLQLASTSVGLIVIPQIIYLREPMRWLLANGRSHEVVEQLKIAAAVNKSDVQEVLGVFHHLHDQHNSTTTTTNNNNNNSGPISNTRSGDVTTHNGDVTAQTNDDDAAVAVAATGSTTLGESLLSLEAELQDAKAESLNCLDLLRHPRLRLNAVCLWAIWFINSLTYFALYLMSGSLIDNIYLGFFLNTMVELPACVIFTLTVDRLGRRPTLLIFHSIAAVSLLCSGVLVSLDSPVAAVAAIIMSLIGKMGITGSFACIFFFTPEIFPTNIRNLAIGTGSFAARLGGMIAPFTGMLAARAAWAPGALFGTCNLLILVLVRLLPDSKGRELPQTLSDLEGWYHPAPAKEGKGKGKGNEKGNSSIQ